ncbi:hypothetical protein C7M51_03357 [Mixta intestinalis]|uniref:DNA (cytosine-5-)-methyltransferase n=1 Tax=Mixta intestinalis TaxID=1615494 RepID=A0A6P1Q203_9GAMM|nr:hypothetical protein C7M51_03357 [Mixta intestinalis]
MTLKDSHNATSLPVSASGLTPCAGQDGPMIDQFGQAHAHASLSVSVDQKKEKAINATFSPHGFVLFRSASLTLSLANRLRAKTALIGSTMYKLSWKTRLTPLQVSISALRASVPRTSDSASSGWPTPTANSWKHPSNAGRKGGLNLQTAVVLAGWPTPTATDGKGGYLGGRIRNGKLSTDRLDVTAQLAGWPTPTTIGNNQVAGMGGGGKPPIEGHNSGRCGTDGLTNAVGGFWAGSDWVFCRDGKWRPVKPGLKPLVDGVAGRVGQLRAYGNAIVAPVAEAFIAAYLDSAR